MIAGISYGVEQTDKRQWRAWVVHAGKRHYLGYRDNQSDAAKSAAAVYWSLRGRWEGEAPTKTLLREKCGKYFSAEAFHTDAAGDFILGERGDLRESNDWMVARFSRSLPADIRAGIEAFLEERWIGSREVRDGQLFAVGIGDAFVISVGELLKILSKTPKPTPKTEGMPKVASGALAAQGLHADKMETRYPSMGKELVRVKPNNGAGVVCEHCGAEMYRVRRGRFCSDRCRKAASRLAVTP